MAKRQPKEKTAKAKAAEAANEAVTKAKEAHGKNANATNLKILHDAKVKAEAAAKELARERFETIAVGRVNTAITAIGAVAKCANLKSYLFTADDVTKIETALNEALADISRAYEAALKGGTPKSAAGFSL